MATRKTAVTTRNRRRSATAPAATPRPATTEQRPLPVEMRAGLKEAGRTLQSAGKVASRFARKSMREVTGAAQATREPVKALLHTVRLAGRHIAREAKAAWLEVIPPRTKPARVARRAAK